MNSPDGLWISPMDVPQLNGVILARRSQPPSVGGKVNRLMLGFGRGRQRTRETFKLKLEPSGREVQLQHERVLAPVVGSLVVPPAQADLVRGSIPYTFPGRKGRAGATRPAARDFRDIVPPSR